MITFYPKKYGKYLAFIYGRLHLLSKNNTYDYKKSIDNFI